MWPHHHQKTTYKVVFLFFASNEHWGQNPNGVAIITGYSKLD